MSNSDHIAVGEDIEPHETNPNSALHDVQNAMKKAQDEAEKVEADLEESPEDVIDFNKSKETTTPLKEVAEESDAAPPESADDAPGPLEPPPEWSADDQGIFRSVPEHVQTWLLDRHNSATAQVTERLTQLAPLQRIQEQWQPYVDKIGAPIDQAIDQLFRAEMVLRTGTPEQKRQAIAGLVSTYGVEFDRGSPIPEELSNDPVASALTPQLQQVMEGLHRLQSQVDSRFGEMQQSQQQQQEGALRAFAEQKDEKGNLLHPYFGEVRTLMEALATQAKAAGTATTIEEVYRQACRASPTVWPKIQAAERSADLRERQRAAADKKRAASSVSSSPSSGRTLKDDGKPDESVYETVKRAFHAHGSVAG